MAGTSQYSMNRFTINTTYRPDSGELYSFLSATEFQASVSMDDYIEKVQNNAVFVSLQDEKGIMKGLSISYMNRLERDFAYLTYIAICKEFRGFGAGKSLLAKTIEIVRECGFRRFRLEVRKRNDIAKNMYDSLGFAVVDKTENSYYMELVLWQ